MAPPGQPGAAAIRPRTRQQAKVRAAEGIPPSPPTEVQPTRRKRVVKLKESNITSETTEDASSSQQDQAVPDQTLREGNAGGYVHHAQDAESTREQRDSLSDADRFLLNSTPQHALAPLDHHSPEAKAASTEVIHTSSHQTPTPSNTSALGSSEHRSAEAKSASPEIIHTSAPSPSNTSALFAQIISPAKSTSVNEATPEAAPSSQSIGEQATRVELVSTQTDVGEQASRVELVSTQTDAPEQATRVESVSTQTDGPAASVASPTIHTTSQPQSQTVVLRDVSVQTEQPLDTFKEMGRYGYYSAIAKIPNFCNITLHLGGGKEIKIMHVPDTSIRRLDDILDPKDELSWRRNWLTSEEIAEEAAEKAAKEAARARDQAAARARVQAEADARAEAEARAIMYFEAKRKREEEDDDEEDDMPEAQRRRVNPLAPSPSAIRRRRKLWAKSGNGLGKSLRATQSTLLRANPSLEFESGPYNTNGELLLSSNINPQIQHDDLIEGGPAGSIAATNNANADIPSSSDVQSPTAPSDADSSDGPAATQIDEPPPRTPQRGSWFPQVVTSALRFMPNIRRRNAAPATPRTNTAKALDQRIAQTEPRRPMPGHSDFGQRLQTSQLAAQKNFRTKENILTIKKVKEEREKLSVEWDQLEKERKITEEARRMAEEERKVTEQARRDIEAAHRIAYSQQPTGSKRQRVSPTVIPNPEGSTFGLDLNYFGASDSDDEEDLNASRKPYKFPRPNGPHHSPSKPSLPNTPGRSKVPAAGTRTPPSDQANKYTGSLFADSLPNVFDQSTTYPNELTIAKDDPRFNHSGHFEIPCFSPGSSDEGSGEEEEVANQPVGNSPSAASAATQKAAGASSDHIVSTSSPQQPVQGSMFPPVTPAQKLGGAAAEKRGDPEAARTLERNRELLRAKIAGQKSVLSPKDIQSSPSKAHVSRQPATQQTVQPTAPAIFFEPQQANTGTPTEPTEMSTGSQDNAGGFSILGAASRTSPKSTAQRLMETLPHTQKRMESFQSYKDYQQTMDPKVKELLESTWNADDEKAAIEEFRAGFTDYYAAQKQDTAAPGPSQSQNVQRAADDDEAFDDEDHESLYDDDEDRDNDEHDDGADDSEEALLDESEEDDQTQAPTPPNPTALQDFRMDPKVAAFLNAQWTAEDDAYASDEFKNQFASLC
ncbi:MAG: hypothetical protein Q9221_007375 [Calogaya cf. arnoldii]